MKSSKRQARQERRQAQQRRGQLRWAVYIAIGAVILVALIIWGQRASGPRQTTYSQKDGNSLGSADAPVQMDEFIDFQCIHCYNSYNSVEEQLITQLVDTGDVHYTLHPVGFLGPDSVNAAEGAYCAADQNLFWEFHDIIFAAKNFSNSNNGSYSDTNLINFAGQIEGMDVDAFSNCLTSDENLATIQAAHDLAQSVGVTGTPGFVVNGTVLQGEQSFATLQDAVNTAMDASN